MAVTLGQAAGITDRWRIVDPVDPVNPARDEIPSTRAADVLAAREYLKWRHNAGSISRPEQWRNDPKDFEWRARDQKQHCLVLYHRPTEQEVCLVEWDERYGWDVYSLLWLGYVGGDGHGHGDRGRDAAMGMALDHALVNPLDSPTGPWEDV